MALEWVVLGCAVSAEAAMLILLTRPLPALKDNRLRRSMISASQRLMKPLLTVIPFCMFLLLDIYWKYETLPKCEGPYCTPTEQLRHQKSMMKSQRNAVLIASALLFYWLLFAVTNLVVRLEQLNEHVDRLKEE